MNNLSRFRRGVQEAPLIGAWCLSGSPVIAEILARQGYDFVVVDLQHGQMGIETAIQMIGAIIGSGAIPVARVPVNEPGVIGRLLDAGAAGLIIPMIQGVDDARRAVAATRYPPLGQRSFGPFLAALRHGPEYVAQANEDILLFAMIETAEALKVVEEIAELPGVDGLFLGPFDLSCALGLPPGDNDGEPRFDEALARVSQAAAAHGRIAGVLTTGALTKRRIGQGFSFLSAITDLPAFAGQAAATLSEAKASQETVQC